MSYDEYYAWVDSHTHSEWVDGEVMVFMPPIPRHDQIVVFLVTLMRFFVDHRQRGRVYVAPFEMRLREGRSYREPDLLFVLSDHLHRIEFRRLNGPADLVIEVLSEDDPNCDLVEKYDDYEEARIPE
jgi:Uma2 family endonuclease